MCLGRLRMGAPCRLEWVGPGAHYSSALLSHLGPSCPARSSSAATWSRFALGGGPW